MSNSHNLIGEIIDPEVMGSSRFGLLLTSPEVFGPKKFTSPHVCPTKKCVKLSCSLVPTDDTTSFQFLVNLRLSIIVSLQRNLL